MAEAVKQPLFRNINANEEDKEITEVESLCLNCHQNGTTNIFLTKIPHYKEIILMSFLCPHCGYRNNETQFGGSFQAKGIEINLHVSHPKDLNRQVIKSDYASIKIPELDFEIPPQSDKGEITTVEGILSRVVTNLNGTLESQEDPATALKIKEFLRKLIKYKNVEDSFHLVLKDPSGNSFVENPLAPQNDPGMKSTHYSRSSADDEMLGLFENKDESQTPKSISNIDGPLDDLQDDDDLCLTKEVMTFQTNCHLCNSPCETNMKSTNIPHFKEVVIMATNCESCGHRSNEVKSGAGIEPLGKKFKLLIKESEDLNRNVLKSETCNILIPELELEAGAQTLSGRFTTVEGLLDNLLAELRHNFSAFLGDSSAPCQQTKMEAFLENLNKVKSGTLTAHLILDDPAGNSYLQSISDSDEHDARLDVSQYERSFEQNEDLGLNDMKTENYAESS